MSSLKGLDEYIAGGHYRTWSVEIRCIEPQPGESEIGCGWAGTGRAWEEYGTGDIEPEDCPNCHGQLKVED